MESLNLGTNVVRQFQQVNSWPEDGQIWPKHVSQVNFNFNTVLS
jgi:hypothetical protein